jgi:hypothetical protein
MMPDDQRNNIISSGLHFMRSITEAYGADEGMRLWETIANTLDPNLKGEIFFAMIAGTHNDTIMLRGVCASTDRVARIKEIRNWTGYGLKEAKDTSDWVEAGKTIQLKVRPQEHHMAIMGLRRVGFTI